MLLKYIPQNGLFVSELSLSLKEVRFYKLEFTTSKPVSNIKYYHLGFFKNNLFYLFNDQLNYVLANYFTKFETIKSNVNRFLSDLLMVLFIKKLSYQNTNK